MEQQLTTLDVSQPVWNRFFTVAPLVVVGSRESDHFNLAPKHMATPLGWDNYFGFVCTPTHRTYHNIQTNKEFTITFPHPTEMVMASLTAMARSEEVGQKPILNQIPTFPARKVEGIFLKGGYVFLECQLDRIIDGFGINSLICGKIVSAHVDKRALRVSDDDEQRLIYEAPLFAYLAPGRWASISDTRTFPFPANFKL